MTPLTRDTIASKKSWIVRCFRLRHVVIIEFEALLNYAVADRVVHSKFAA